MQKLFSNICLLFPMLLRKENKTINRWSLRWRSVPRDPRTAGCFSEHISSPHLSVSLHSLLILMLLPTFVSFHSADCFQHPLICLFNHTILHRLRFTFCFLLHVVLAFPCSCSIFFPYLFSPIPCFPDELLHGISRQLGGRGCHMVRRPLLPWLQWLYREYFLAALLE